MPVSSTESSSTSSKISVIDMENLVQNLVNNQNRVSTNKTYLAMWRQFNKFVITLDKIPPTWEHRAILFAAHLIEKGKQSSTVKSYMSGIKRLLVNAGYNWKDNFVLLNSMTKACRLINDQVRTRLPIKYGLLETILFEIERIYKNQWYLQCMYKAMFMLCYYGMMRIGEVTESPHVLLARNVNRATNKNKLLMILYSSKTHGYESAPQEIKITAAKDDKRYKAHAVHRNFCPFELIGRYIDLRPEYSEDDEQFFVFSDNSPVKPMHAHALLHEIIKRINLDSSLYGMHSFRIGRTCDLVKFGYSIEEIKRLGRWKSNVVYKYIR